jgi:hypothetical protein
MLLKKGSYSAYKLVVNETENIVHAQTDVKRVKISFTICIPISAIEPGVG